MGTGVAQGDELIRLVDATLKGETAALPAARQAVIDTLGTAGLVDAAGVIGTFTMQNRIADALGLPLDTPLEMATRRIRTEMGVDEFSAAAYTDVGGRGRALLARVVEALLPRGLKLLSRLKR